MDLFSDAQVAVAGHHPAPCIGASGLILDADALVRVRSAGTARRALVLVATVTQTSAATTGGAELS